MNGGGRRRGLKVSRDELARGGGGRMRGQK